ncbi:MAG: RagB/SusD family nutrient uptake outer membrane protein [Chitinophagaceae bacterium]
MRSIYNRAVIFGCALLIFTMGCKKSFLEEPVPTTAVSHLDVFKTEAGVRSYFTGIYRNLRSQWQNLNATAGGTTDSWGYTSVHLARVNKGLDIINIGGFYQFDYRHENREPNFRRTRFTWGFFYEHINQANIIIDGLEKSALTAATKQRLQAEARALRAWLYFDLVREFQHTVTKDANAPGIPVYELPTDASNKGKPRGTIKQVYDLINSDIAFAIQHLGVPRLLKSNINLNVAYGMAARIYLEQKKWSDARNAAIKAREGYTLEAGDYGKTDLASAEWIWGFPQTTANGGQSTYYGTPSAFYEKTGDGYDNLYVSTTLVATFSNTDVRNLFFISNNSAANARRYSTNKFGAESPDDITLINGTTAKLRMTDFEEDLPMMRVAEMYLIEAEAGAELGEAVAGDVLFTLQKNRNTAALKSGNAGQALINEVLLERRKELYGELGIDYMDAKRRQLPLVRTGNHPLAFLFNIPANDARFLLKIPQSELDTNEFIDESHQNQ